MNLTVEEVSHVPAEDGQHSIVAVLGDEVDERLAQSTHEVLLRQLQHLYTCRVHTKKKDCLTTQIMMCTHHHGCR